MHIISKLSVSFKTTIPYDGLPNSILFIFQKHYFGFAEGGRRLGIKNKLIYFVLLSTYTTFASK